LKYSAQQQNNLFLKNCVKLIFIIGEFWIAAAAISIEDKCECSSSKVLCDIAQRIDLVTHLRIVSTATVVICKEEIWVGNFVKTLVIFD
jgi:hypothetical protein